MQKPDIRIDLIGIHVLNAHVKIFVQMKLFSSFLFSSNKFGKQMSILVGGA
jgi:hypothetical protein